VKKLKKKVEKLETENEATKRSVWEAAVAQL
jgi:hypothetical protein